MYCGFTRSDNSLVECEVASWLPGQRRGNAKSGGFGYYVAYVSISASLCSTRSLSPLRVTTGFTLNALRCLLCLPLRRQYDVSKQVWPGLNATHDDLAGRAGDAWAEKLHLNRGTALGQCTAMKLSNGGAAMARGLTPDPMWN